MTDKKAAYIAAYAVVGELVLLASALDHQVMLVLIEAMHLAKSKMLEPVLATIDTARKLEMLKQRGKHIEQAQLRKPLLAYINKIETVSRWRNVVCHTVMLPDEAGPVFVPRQAAKMLKTLNLHDPVREQIPIDPIKQAIQTGEAALSEGEQLISSLQRINAELAKRLGRSPRSR